MGIGEYRKLIAALVGLAVLMLNRHYGVDLIGTESLLVDLAISGFTAVNVWFWPNDPED